MTGISRRAILAHGGVVAGVTTAGGVGWTLTRPAPVDAALGQLHVSQLRVLGPAQRLGVGGTRALQGLLHLSADGAATGTFFASSVVLAAPDLVDPQLGYLETQLFTLPGGTIAGVGTVHHNGVGEFTVTGGSGEYVNLRGAYTSRQSADHTGFGVATFTFETGESTWPATRT